MKKPSVSDLIGLLDKPGLMFWANKIGLKGESLAAYKTKIRNKGTSIHSIVESFSVDGLLSSDDELNKKMINFFSDKEIIDSEQSFETEYYTGRYDVRLKWKGLIYKCDYKSSSKVYLENKIQLAAYKLAFPDDDDSLAVIHLKDFVISPINLDMNLYEELLIALSKVYELKYKLND
jgi:hypothetical protein